MDKEHIPLSVADQLYTNVAMLCAGNTHGAISLRWRNVNFCSASSGFIATTAYVPSTFLNAVASIFVV